MAPKGEIGSYSLGAWISVMGRAKMLSPHFFSASLFGSKKKRKNGHRDAQKNSETVGTFPKKTITEAAQYIPTHRSRGTPRRYAGSLTTNSFGMYSRVAHSEY